MYSRITEHIEIDRKLHSVCVDGEQVHLTGLEYRLLEYLASHANRVCSRTEILDHVWGSRFRYDTGTIDVHLNALRRKLGLGKDNPIHTVRGVGLLLRSHIGVTHETIDLQSFLHEWLRSHETDIHASGLQAHVQLTPFVNTLTISPESLRRWLDASLEAIRPDAHRRYTEPQTTTTTHNTPIGVLRLSSKLTMHLFIISMDINSAICELRIPIYGE